MTIKNNRHIRKIVFMVIDIIIVLFSTIATTWLINGTTNLEANKFALLLYIPFEIALVLSVFLAMKLYHSLWQYAGMVELLKIIVAIGFITIVNFVVIISTKIFFQDIAIINDVALLPIRFPVIYGVIVACLVVISRFSYRLIKYIRNSNKFTKKVTTDYPVMIIGAGDAGCTIVQELLDSEKISKLPVCIIDDDASKTNTYIYGIPVVGTRNSIVEMAKKYHVKLAVKSSLTREEGTYVKEVNQVEKMLVRGVTRDNDCARVALCGVEDTPGKAYTVFALLSKKKIGVDLIIQSIGRDGKKDISFTVAEGDLPEVLDILEKNKDTIKVDEITSTTQVSKVSIVGAGMVNNAGVATTMFEALYNAHINISMIATSEIKVSVLVDQKDAERAVVAIHDKFMLD